MPPSCVHASPGDPACVLVVHHVRERKAGPQIPVTVAQCRTHRRGFTLYPLGHVPYGRMAVAPVTLDGQVVLSTQSEPTDSDRRSPAWRATQLGVAFAAVDDPTVKLTDRRWWAIQTPERLARTAALLGIHPGLSVPDAEAIAFRLEVPRLVLRQMRDPSGERIHPASIGNPRPAPPQQPVRPALSQSRGCLHATPIACSVSPDQLRFSNGQGGEPRKTRGPGASMALQSISDSAGCRHKARGPQCLIFPTRRS